MTTHLTAAYMAMGLNSHLRIGEIQDQWGNGQLELVDTLVHYADYSWALGDAAYKYCGEFAGVIQYEVDEPAGFWFGAEILESEDGRAPTADRFCESLRHWVFEFARQSFDRPSEGTLIGLRAVLDAVPLPKPHGS